MQTLNTKPLIIKAVSVHAERDDGRKTRLLENVSIQLNQGEWVGLVGPNGSGKSTLAMLLAGHPQAAAGGAALFDGSMDRGFAGTEPLPFVTQDPDAAIVGSTPWEDVLLGLEQRAEAGKAASIVIRAEEILRGCGLWDVRHRPVETLSGGQRQLLAAAGCSAFGAPLLVFDEAGAMLDAASRAEVLGGARAIWRSGATVVWISHRLEELEAGDRIIALQQGCVAFDGTAESFFEPESGCGMPVVAYAAELEGGKPTGAYGAKSEVGKPEGMCAAASEGGKTKELYVAPPEGDRRSACERLGYRPPFAVETALALREMGYRLEPLPFSKFYRGKSRYLEVTNNRLFFN